MNNRGSPGRRRRKRGGWTRDGVKVREKVKGSGVWWVFVNCAGRRTSYQKGNREAADAFANELRAGFKLVEARQRGLTIDELQRIGLADTDGAPAGDSGITFADYASRVLDRWEPNEKEPEHGLKFTTWRDYSGCLKRRLIPALGKRPLASLKRRDIRTLADALRADGLSEINIRKHRRIISSILSEAVEDELIAANPALGGHRRRRSKEKQVKRRQDPFTQNELAALFETAETHAIERCGSTAHPFRAVIPFLLCLAHTGMRLGEAIALSWSDVDWRSGTVLVRRSYARRHLDVPKGGKARKVELSTRLQTVLRSIYEARYRRVAALEPVAQVRLEADQAARAADELIFPGVDGGFLDEHNLRHRIWEPLLVAANLRRRRLHDLRHTFATLHLQSGTDPVWVSAQLGHHSVGFTLSTYAHLPLGDRGGHADRIDSAPKCTHNAPKADIGGADAAEGHGLPQQDPVLPRVALA
jgi:integrase